MSRHQADIFREGTEHHIYLEFRCQSALPRLPGRALIAETIDGGGQVVAFGQRLASGLKNVAIPAELDGFSTIEGRDGLQAPATQGDIFVWLHGAKRDELFARALAWRTALTPVAEIAFENHGFRFRDNRDLTGFIDGTANPKQDARFAAALIDDGPCAGGSFVLAQRWQHDLAAFAALPLGDQERVFGRTKQDSVELVGAAMPPDSHVSRTDLAGIKIYRRSSPVGGVGDAGLFFLAFSAKASHFRTLLQSMFGLSDDGRRDRMLSYTKPVTGSYYYAPPAAMLAATFED